MAVIRRKKPLAVVDAASRSPEERAEAFFSWLSRSFVFTAGPKRGQPFTLDDFQQDYIRKVLARDGEDPKFRTCILSTPRKQGKTATFAALLLGFMLPDSPIHIPACKAAITAVTGRHALMIFRACLDMLEAVGREHQARIIQTPSPGWFSVGEARCDIYAASRNSGHGASLHLALVDEAGLLPDNSTLIDSFLDALAIENGQLLVTGTRLSNRAYNELIDNPPEGVAVVLYGADPSDDPADPATWRKANPGGFKSLAVMRDAYAKAKASGTIREFCGTNLNMRLTPAKELLIELPQLQAAYAPDAAPVEGEPCFVGLDLGGSAAQSAAVVVYASGFVKLLAAFPDQPMTLAERGQRDGCGNAYERARERGDLITTSGMVTDIGEFLTALADLIGPHPVASISCDRYRSAELLTALQRAGIVWKPRFRGQGPKDGNLDILATRKLFLAGALKLHRSELLELAIGETDCRVSYTGAVSLQKASRVSRIDLSQALVLAASALMEEREKVPVTYTMECW